MIPLKDSNPTERFPVVTVLLIVLNILVFFYELALGDRQGEYFISAFALVPARFLQSGTAISGPLPDGVTLITSQFLHGGIFHLAGNMLYLWIFGNNVEDAMGRVRFFLFYLLCGMAAAVSHAMTNAQSLTPMIGASGAVSGVLGAYLLLYPQARVLTLFILGFFARMIEVPAMIILGFWLVFQFLNAMVTQGSGGGVAWYAHIGGFLAGMVLIGIFKKRSVRFWGGRRFGVL